MLRKLRDNPDLVAVAVLSLCLGLGQRSPVAGKISHRITEAWDRSPRVVLDYEPPAGRCAVQKLMDHLKY